MKKWLIGALLAATVAAPANAQDNRNWRSRQQGWQESRGDQPRPERPRPAPQAQAQAQPPAQAAPTFQTRGGGRNHDGDRGGWRGRGEAQAGGGVQAQVPQGSWRTRQQAGGADRFPGGFQTQADGQRRDWQRQRSGRPDLAQQQSFDGQGRLDDRSRFDRNRRDGGRDFNRDVNRDRRVDRFTSADARRGGNAWRTDDRGGSRGYNDGRRYDDRRGYNDGRQFGRNDGGWNRGWRSDNRYDWNRYRSNNRYAYRLPRYYSPYGWNYGYRRFSIGVTLSSVLWGQDYWIDDPWSYRLPEAYGPYRWVRYYNDALLVDLETGQVIDTVYDIFWG